MLDPGSELLTTGFELTEKGALIFSMWMRPSCTGSIPAAISTSLRAAASGLAKGRFGCELH
jgi:hypothetical protein